MRKFLFSVAVLVLLIPVLGLAAEIRSAEVVSKNETPKNLYLAGQNPTIDADVTGDLVVAGGDVTVNGNVEEGVLAAGGVLNLNGNIGRNVRVAGGTVNVESIIGGDLVVFGGDVVLGTKSVVTGDVIIFAGTVELKGKVLGSVKNSYVGDVLLSGNVDGDVVLAGVDTVKIDSAGVIDGTLKYSAKQEAEVSSMAKIGGVEYTKVSTRNVDDRDGNFGGKIFGMLMAFVTLLVITKVAPKFSINVLESATVNPWAKVGIGFLAVVVTPIALLLLAITFVGWGVMGYLGLFYVMLFALAGTLSALLSGSFVWKYFRKENEFEVSWKTVAIGIVLVTVAKMIPVIGWVVVFLVFLLLLGTLTTMSYGFIKSQRA